MGKLMDRLTQQLKRPENKKDAEECIEIYNWLKSTDKDGYVWSSRWSPLVNIEWISTGKSSYQSEAIYSLNTTGCTLLKGIKKDKS
jgi:hypothetical protein